MKRRIARLALMAGVVVLMSLRRPVSQVEVRSRGSGFTSP